jgi:anti-sigma B factor antagonist
MAFNQTRHSCEITITYDILTPQHEIDSLNGGELKKYILSAKDESSAFVIDFSSVAYVNSSGLRELIQMVKYVTDVGKRLFLVNVPAEIRKIFVHTNLDRLFTFCDSLDAAIRLIR